MSSQMDNVANCDLRHSTEGRLHRPLDIASPFHLGKLGYLAAQIAELDAPKIMGG